MRDRIVDPRLLWKQLRELQWTPLTFMDNVGYSRSTVYALLSGRRDLTDVRARHVAQVLGCTVEDFTTPRPVEMPRGRME
jgi:hypothetical protein